MLRGWVETGRQGTPFGSDGKVLSFVRSEISRPFFPPMAA
ncbi:hypothetical protein MAXJ12_27608 [Mesorhizobium alhagi CCNWXJ12-2]|jgi:hypothetical protein|uniref:Uncharacterized protein n=1 Tax=Mesorhizobium alhagi CCNWXJ12-2 TaxID=1107882 RepID=H0HZ85_9HYPH|nr:hypothetical protein MAXJ12_27608 [Mesorhizobium alhagi CCNWXJ12-2]